MCENLALSDYLLHDFQALLPARSNHQRLHLEYDLLLFLELPAGPQSLQVQEYFLIDLPLAVLIIFHPNSRDLFLLQELHITFSCSLQHQPKHLLLLSEPSKAFSFGLFVIFGPHISQGADLMEPAHDHEVTLALEDQCLELVDAESACVEVIFKRNFVDESSPYFHGVKDQFILTLSLAIFLQNTLIFRVQLVDVYVGKVMIQPLGPGIRQVGGLLEQPIYVPAEVLKRLLVLGEDLSVVEQAQVGGARGEGLLLGLGGIRVTHCLKLSFL